MPAISAKRCKGPAWAGKKNGELLALADGQFDALVTVDKGFAHQQRLKGRMIAVLVIHARSNDLDDIRQHVSAAAQALNTIRAWPSGPRRNPVEA